VIELDGQNAGLVNGLVIHASDTVVKGLVINRFGRAGILVGGSGSVATHNRIEGNFVGTDPAGFEERRNVRGVQIVGSDNTIGGIRPRCATSSPATASVSRS
jgi:hypothetical protein